MRLPASRAEVRSAPLLEQTLIGLRYVWDNVPDPHDDAARGGRLGLFGFSYAVLLPAFAADVLQVGEVGLGALNVAVGRGRVGRLADRGLAGRTPSARRCC